MVGEESEIDEESESESISSLWPRIVGNVSLLFVRVMNVLTRVKCTYSENWGRFF